MVHATTGTASDRARPRSAAWPPLPCLPALLGVNRRTGASARQYLGYRGSREVELGRLRREVVEPGADIRVSWVVQDLEAVAQPHAPPPRESAFPPPNRAARVVPICDDEMAVQTIPVNVPLPADIDDLCAGSSPRPEPPRPIPRRSDRAPEDGGARTKHTTATTGEATTRPRTPPKTRTTTT